MGSRTNLHKVLKDVPGIIEVYYQPPESMKLEYPCIVYKLSRFNNRHADDKEYIKRKAYDLTLISQKPDVPAVDYLESLPYCTLQRPFVSNNLNHYNYTIYY